MIAAVIVAVVALVALVYVAAPARREPHPLEPDPEPSPAEARKRSALTALLDLEEESELGKLTGAELAALRQRYESEAVEALAALEAGSGDPLEAEILAARARLLCGSCGALRTPGEPCPRCGA